MVRLLGGERDERGRLLRFYRRGIGVHVAVRRILRKLSASECHGNIQRAPLEVLNGSEAGACSSRSDLRYGCTPPGGSVRPGPLRRGRRPGGPPGLGADRGCPAHRRDDGRTGRGEGNGRCGHARGNLRDRPGPRRRAAVQLPGDGAPGGGVAPVHPIRDGPGEQPEPRGRDERGQRLHLRLAGVARSLRCLRPAALRKQLPPTLGGTRRCFLLRGERVFGRARRISFRGFL